LNAACETRSFVGQEAAKDGVAEASIAKPMLIIRQDFKDIRTSKIFL
jgi:hypothetical protein